MTFQKLVSQNVRGTPAMRYKAVLHDLRVVKSKNPTVVCLQEFKWKWYWTALSIVFPPLRWGRFPTMFLGARSSQPILWDRRVNRKIDTMRILIHSASEWTQDRFFNAILLEDKDTKLRHWVTNAHLIPDPDPGTHRGLLWSRGIGIIRRKVQELVSSNYASIHVGDYNSRAEVLGPEMLGHRVDYHGFVDTIDKVMSINGSETKVVPRFIAVIPLDELATDHRGRVLGYRVVGVHESS